MKASGDWEGRLIGDRYEIEVHLHTSEMSSVFKAWDRQSECPVAVKIAADTSIFDIKVSRLRQEAEALRSLNHPNIVHFIDSGKLERSVHFLVLEYLDGDDLEFILRRRRSFSISDCISVLVQMLQALGHMHEKGIVHRDIKSSNVIIFSRVAKIIDLGLVKFMSENNQFRRPTPTGSLLGTRLYASPEQAMGIGRYDGRSDIYSCGVVLFEILTKSMPFYVCNDGEEEWEDYWNHLRSFSKTHGVPQELQEIVWKALSVDPAMRYQTTEEMRLALLAVRPL